MNWEKTAAAKRQSVIDAIPKKWILDSIPSVKEAKNVNQFVERILSEKELEITRLTVIQLADKIAIGKYSAVETLEAFAHRVSITHQLTTCCSEIFFEKGFAKAKELDEYLAQNGKTVGPLHGVPISFKDQVNLEGIDSAIGYVGLTFQPKTANDVSILAQILENAGAVFYIKSTTPMAMMAGCTVSNIYGHTYNAYNRALSSGGSSGGEGVILGAKGAPFGFGTDIGGSIRVPSSFNGIYGLRGCSGRLPYCKVTNSFANAPVLASVIGPMSSDLDDLEFITKLIIDSKPWLNDPKCPPIPWRPIVNYPKKLSFGIISGNGLSCLHPPIKRALKLAKDALIAQGHEIIEWEPPISLEKCTSLAVSIYGADGYKEVVEDCAKSGEPIVKEILFISGGGGGLPREISIHEYWNLAGLRYQYQQEVDKYWLSTSSKTSTGRPLDAIISPVWESASFKSPDFGMFSSTYTATFNILDYACVATPVTFADKTIDVFDRDYKPINEFDKNIHEYYDPDLFDGTPAGVQVVAPRYEEERAIYLAGVLRDALKGKSN